MTDSAARFLGHFDLDVTLRDAALDEQNRPTRRMIANAAIGMHVEDAFYSVRELREAVTWIHEGELGGKLELGRLLDGRRARGGRPLAAAGGGGRGGGGAAQRVAAQRI